MLHVLVVDDEKNMRTTLADILRDEGIDVTTAVSGEQAVKICSKRHFDVVLMDVRMPGIDGVEAFLRIRKRDPGVRVIMMSAYSVEQLERTAIAAGALAFLRKPFDVAQVLTLLREVR